MKNTILYLSVIIMAGMSLFACRIADTVTSASGAPYEVLVLLSDNDWESSLGDTLRSVLLEPVSMINQTEPRLDVLRADPNAFTGLLTKHRNILAFKIDPSAETATTNAAFDVYAKPQIVATVTAPSRSVLIDYLDSNREELLQLFEVTERKRFLAHSANNGVPSLEKMIADMFGMKISIPAGYTFRSGNEKDFLWISNEYPQSSQGLIIYTYPYSGKEDMALDSLVKRRNEFVSRVPGPSEGSYMTTSPYVTPDITYMRIDGRPWAELRGFWDVEGDFMGGPMVNYTTVNPATGMAIAIDGYVYSPRKNKRNYLREIEVLVYSAEIAD